jgi:hypothetical protein
MSSEQPEPPFGADSPDELLAHVNNNPADWLMYFRHMNNYAAALKDEIESLRLTQSNYETVIALHKTKISELEGVVKYQEGQLQINQDKVIHLEVDKQRLLDAATPAVQTLLVTPSSTPNPPADLPTDHVPRPSTPAAAARSGSSHLSEKLPDPKEFNGAREDLRRFTQQIYGKMTANQDRFPTASARLTYVAGRLTGKAYELILPKTKFGVPAFLDYPEMLAYLETAFGDPDRIQNAQNRLYRLRQANQDFSTYFSEFQRLALEGEMPEAALSPLLFQGISRELQDMLLHSPAPSREFQVFTKHLQMLDNRYRQHQQQVNRTRTLATTRTPTTYTTTTPAIPQSQPNLRGRSPPRTQPAAPPGEPMDLSRQQRNQHRRDNNLCLYCGGADHRVASCPNRRPIQINNAQHHLPSPPAPTSQPGSPVQSVRSHSPAYAGNGVSLV